MYLILLVNIVQRYKPGLRGTLVYKQKIVTL